MEITEDRLEHYCRLGLLVIAVLHWLVFALMVSSDVSMSDQAPRALGNLASAVLPFLQL